MRMSTIRLGLVAALAIVGTAGGHAQQIAASSTASIPADLGYLLYRPKGYDGSQDRYPLVVWLHGGDQGGSDVGKLKTSGLPGMIEKGADFPFLVFSPQNPSEELLFPIERVKAALDAVVADNRVDPSRIYVVGYSRGAFGAWAMAEQFPGAFAAVVAIAGGGNRHYLNRTNEKAAFWAIHGTDDDTILLSDSVILYERLKMLKREARLSVLEGVTHEGVEAAALGQPDLWDWLLRHRLESGSAGVKP